MIFKLYLMEVNFGFIITCCISQEQLEDTKGVISICNSKLIYGGKHTKYNDRQNTTQKTKD
jgi:hypothetical protein